MPEFKPLTKGQAKLFARLESRLGRLHDKALLAQDEFEDACEHSLVAEANCPVCVMHTKLADVASALQELYTQTLQINTAEGQE